MKIKVNPIAYLAIKGIEGAINGTKSLKRKKMKKQISDRLEYIKVLYDGGAIDHETWAKEHNELADSFNKIIDYEDTLRAREYGMTLEQYREALSNNK